MPGEVAVVGIGMITAVGLSAAETAASVRSATARFTETSLMDKRFEPFRQQAEDFICRIVPGSPSSTKQYTPGGLMHKSGYANL